MALATKDESGVAIMTDTVDAATAAGRLAAGVAAEPAGPARDAAFAHALQVLHERRDEFNKQGHVSRDYIALLKKAGLFGVAVPEQFGGEPQPLDRLLASTVQGVTLDRLVARGLVHICGFTPSDAAHVLGRQTNWNGEAARLAAVLFSRRRDGAGNPIAPDAEAISARVLDAVTRRSAEAILETALSEDGMDGGPTVAHGLVQRALDGARGIAGIAIALDRPVIGLGASAPLHYAALPALVGSGCVVPPDTDVANALGAVVGQVRVTAQAQVSQPQPGLFRVSSTHGIADFRSEEAALAEAGRLARAAAAAGAAEAGADTVEIAVAHDIRAADIDGERAFVEAIVSATASGRPRIAH